MLRKPNTKKASGIITPLFRCFPREIKEVLCTLLVVYQLVCMFASILTLRVGRRQSHVCINLDSQGWEEAISNVYEWKGICLKFQKSDVSNLQFSYVLILQSRWSTDKKLSCSYRWTCYRHLVFQWNFTQIIVI